MQQASSNLPLLQALTNLEYYYVVDNEPDKKESHWEHLFIVPCFLLLNFIDFVKSCFLSPTDRLGGFCKSKFTNLSIFFIKKNKVITLDFKGYLGHIYLPFFKKSPFLFNFECIAVMQ